MVQTFFFDVQVFVVSRYDGITVFLSHVSRYFQLMLKFWGPMPIIIWIAIIVEGVVGDWPSFAVLWALQLINGILGFVEGNAQSLIQKN